MKAVKTIDGLLAAKPAVIPLHFYWLLYADYCLLLQ